MATDRDGMKIHVLLHVLDGVMDELEIYREDSQPLQNPLSPGTVTVIVY
ncbi:MAG TPA: hypothetical protein VE569_03235 [Acidimicrobiia bacterium]|nr:hypothetical protein [Acidimicrobiia bacterium]